MSVNTYGGFIDAAADPELVAIVDEVRSRTSPRGGGVFVAVVGSSGAGKDTLIGYARERLGPVARVRFIRRVVTRKADPAHEDHIAIGDDAFADGIRHKAFALHWQANGLRYAVPAAADLWFATGDVVVANLSRASLSEALARYRRLAVVNVTAPLSVLQARLQARAREDEGDISARLARIGPLGVDARIVLDLDNSGPVQQAGDRLTSLLGAFV